MFDYGASIKVRWIELLEPQQKQEEQEETDDRSCAEIVHGIWERIKGTSDDSI